MFTTELVHMLYKQTTFEKNHFMYFVVTLAQLQVLPRKL